MYVDKLYLFFFVFTDLFNLNESEQRTLSIAIGSTPSNVGPGKYEIYNGIKNKGSKSTAPFGATAERDNVLLAQTISPGPGCYKTKSAFDRIPGGRIAFKNGPRLVNSTPVDNHPPPGAYFQDNFTDSAVSEKAIEKRFVFINSLMLVLYLVKSKGSQFVSGSFPANQ